MSKSPNPYQSPRADVYEEEARLNEVISDEDMRSLQKAYESRAEILALSMSASVVIPITVGGFIVHSERCPDVGLPLAAIGLISGITLSAIRYCMVDRQFQKYMPGMRERVSP